VPGPNTYDASLAFEIGERLVRHDAEAGGLGSVTPELDGSVANGHTARNP
jgi:hypothetical protein